MGNVGQALEGWIERWQQGSHFLFLDTGSGPSLLRGVVFIFLVAPTQVLDWRYLHEAVAYDFLLSTMLQDLSFFQALSVREPRLVPPGPDPFNSVYR